MDNNLPQLVTEQQAMFIQTAQNLATVGFTLLLVILGVAVRFWPRFRDMLRSVNQGHAKEIAQNAQNGTPISAENPYVQGVYHELSRRVDSHDKLLEKLDDAIKDNGNDIRAYVRSELQKVRGVQDTLSIQIDRLQRAVDERFNRYEIRLSDLEKTRPSAPFKPKGGE